MNWLRKLYPFNAEQTVNIMSEFGPLVAMFIMNAAYGINVGTWALIISTVIAIVTMLKVLAPLPMFPMIASTVEPSSSSSALMICTQVVAIMPPKLT